MSHRPPAIACGIVACVLPANLEEAILGDLCEEHALRAVSGSPFLASLWFWRQTWCLIPYSTWSAIRCGGLSSLGAASGIYAFVMMLKFGVGLLMHYWMRSFSALQFLAVALFIFTAINVTAGCVAARIRAGTTVLLALILVLTRLASIYILPRGPFWFDVGTLLLTGLSVLVPPAVARSLRPAAKRAV